MRRKRSNVHIHKDLRDALRGLVKADVNLLDRCVHAGVKDLTLAWPVYLTVTDDPWLFGCLEFNGFRYHTIRLNCSKAGSVDRLMFTLLHELKHCSQRELGELTDVDRGAVSYATDPLELSANWYASHRLHSLLGKYLATHQSRSAPRTGLPTVTIRENLSHGPQ